MNSPLRSSRLALSVIALSATALLAGCSSTTADAPAASSDSTAPFFDELPQDIQDAGKITVASGVGYPPFEEFDTDGTTIVGVDPDIAAALSEQLGVTLTFENVPFESIVPGLAAGRYDMAMSGMSDTLERQKEVTFIDYYLEGPGILTSTADADTYVTLDDLCGVDVAVAKGTTNLDDANAQDAKCQADGQAAMNITVYPGGGEAVSALTAGRVKVFMVGSTSGGDIASKSDGALVMGERYSEGPFGIVFPQESDDLIAAMQDALKALKDDGTYLDILTQYGLEGGAIDEFTVNGSTI